MLLNADFRNKRRLLLTADNYKDIERKKTGLQIFVDVGDCPLHAGWNQAESTVFCYVVVFLIYG